MVFVSLVLVWGCIFFGEGGGGLEHASPIIWSSESQSVSNS